jgi:hypothetical protein
MPKPRKKTVSPPKIETGETRAVDALTVCWMVTVMTVLMLELATVGFRWYASAHPENEPIGAFADVLYLCAALCGVLSLSLAPIVWRIRRVKPPLSIMLFAIVAAALPIILLFARVGLAR